MKESYCSSKLVKNVEGTELHYHKQAASELIRDFESGILSVEAFYVFMKVAISLMYGTEKKKVLFFFFV